MIKKKKNNKLNFGIILSIVIWFKLHLHYYIEKNYIGIK
jgi:hypothetical protein